MRIEVEIPEAIINNIDDIVSDPLFNYNNRDTFITAIINKQLQEYERSVSNIINVYSDGACLGNPGPMGVGVWVPDFSIEIADFIGRGTNNIAEWTALKYAVNVVLYKLKADPEKIAGKHIVFNLDSELVVKQVNGEYNVNDITLLNIAKEVKSGLRELENSCGTNVKWIPRESNKKADELSKRAVKTQTQIDDYKR